MTDKHKEIEDVQVQVMQFANLLLDNGVNPFAIAAVFSQVSFMIYKTTLCEDDYQQMAHTIYESRNTIPKLDTQQKMH